MRRLCDTCEGTGRVRPNPFNEREMLCPAECEDGFVDVIAADVDGKRGTCRLGAGQLTAFGSTLIMETDEGFSIILKVEHLTCVTMR